MEIHGKVAVVTGAGSGIGKSVAEELARRGVAHLAMVDLNPAVEEVAEVLRGQNGKERKVVEAFVGDVTDDAFRKKVFDHLVASGEAPAICVPAAGITRDALSVRLDKATGNALLYPIADFRKTMEINLVSPVYWALEMVARIAEDRHKRGLGRWGPPEHPAGTAIFIGSVSSQGNKGQIAYAATKAGLEGAAATLMKEAIFYGVRCGVIHPGFTDTPMVRALGQEYIDNRILPFTQLRRLIRTEEIADAICFMIANSAVSGELWADAGWHPSA
jgi:NAD(P)-dependent dehydrogenase (short-subunit alcohol dehydrogenase family)